MGTPDLTLYRAAIGQILADAGINRSTIQEMVRQMIAEKVDKQFQYIAAHEVNTYSFKNKINDIFTAAIRSAVRDELKNINISIIAENHHPEEEDDGCVYIEDVTGTIGAWLSADTSGIPPEALSCLREAYKICVDNL